MITRANVGEIVLIRRILNNSEVGWYIKTNNRRYVYLLIHAIEKDAPLDIYEDKFIICDGYDSREFYEDNTIKPYDYSKVLTFDEKKAEELRSNITKDTGISKITSNISRFINEYKSIINKENLYKYIIESYKILRDEMNDKEIEYVEVESLDDRTTYTYINASKYKLNEGEVISIIDRHNVVMKSKVTNIYKSEKFIEYKILILNDNQDE